MPSVAGVRAELRRLPVKRVVEVSDATSWQITFRETRLVARCPRCQVRYKVAREEIGPRGSRLRCTRCELVFRIEVPFDRSASQQPAEQSGLDPDAPRALFVEADENLAKRCSDFLYARGLRCEVVTDGDVALLSLLRNPPRLALIGAYASGLGPRDLIEATCLASDLREVVLVRVASVEGARIPPGSESVQLLEPPDLPEGLAPVLAALDLGANAQAAPRPAAPLVNAARAASAADPEVAAAERLARIVIADIILYNEARFDAAVEQGDLGERLKPELSEARALFEARVSPALRADRDFLNDEIELQASRRRRREQAGR
ncbi:MAG: zinc-ribbon domain-containing protein [Myxococcales bacterium]|nr:zinc-ribbon domain-containing protein [Myxococcales bacterium]